MTLSRFQTWMVLMCLKINSGLDRAKWRSSEFRWFRPITYNVLNSILMVLFPSDLLYYNHSWIEEFYLYSIINYTTLDIKFSVLHLISNAYELIIHLKETIVSQYHVSPAEPSSKFQNILWTEPKTWSRILLIKGRFLETYDCKYMWYVLRGKVIL